MEKPTEFCLNEDTELFFCRGAATAEAALKQGFQDCSHEIMTASSTLTRCKQIPARLQEFMAIWLTLIVGASFCTSPAMRAGVGVLAKGSQPAARNSHCFRPT